jgi:hypothetical protein
MSKQIKSNASSIDQDLNNCDNLFKSLNISEKPTDKPTDKQNTDNILKKTSILNIICPSEIICGKNITKQKRQSLFGKINGGSGSTKPEYYQRNIIEEGTKIKCVKTHIRINYRTNTLVSLPRPNIQQNGFDYSENFDGCQEINGINILINLKCVVETGGSQTRTLREVYHFIEAQLNTLVYGLSDKSDKINSHHSPAKIYYYANILDGDEADKCMIKFKYLLELPEYINVSKYVYVGDLKGYFNWLSKIL